ncbi:MAG: hypothetical protein GF417_00915 [Candidatus Latescibacteria bacterium]|nr:hypothetical protein [bacterium]MBD3422987.1 hypothetical protein [Candidatus Latescibacterota bacterium]
MKIFSVLLLFLLSIFLANCDDEDPTVPDTVARDPSVRIISPVDSGVYILKRNITFAGVGIDDQDRFLPESSLVWESDRDGVLGTGALLITDTLSADWHTITFTGEDSEGRTGSDEITIDLLSAYAYLEDFESDPDWVSLSTETPTNAYWDSLAGNYLVRTFDNLADKYWAYSPGFGPVSGSSMVHLEFDMVCERGNWGTYPGIYLYDSEPTDIANETITFRLSFDWSDQVTRRIQIRDKDQNNTYSPIQSFVDNVWYHLELFYDGALQEADIIITKRDSGALIYNKHYIPFVLDDFSYIAMGYYNQPNYGNAWCPIRVDNIVIQTW